MEAVLIIMLGMLFMPLFVYWWKVLFVYWYRSKQEVYKVWYRVRSSWWMFFRSPWAILYKGIKKMGRHKRLTGNYHKVVSRWGNIRCNKLFQETLRKLKKAKLDLEYKLKEWD